MVRAERMVSMRTTAGVVFKGELLKEVFEEGIIKAGQWAYAQGFDPKDFITVLLLQNGEINHRSIIQVYDYKAGKYILENHYTTCGTFHWPMDKYEEHKAYFTEKYADKRYKVSCWIEY